MTAPASTQMLSIEHAVWNWIETGPKRHAMPVGHRLVRGIMAGFLLSTGGCLVQILTADPWLAQNAAGLLKILQAAVFPWGLVMIVLLQADLVTGEMAIFIASTIKRRVPPWAFLYGWAITFLGNLIGALFYAAILIHFGKVYSDPMLAGAAASANAKVASINFLEIWLRAIGCNALVCIAVFQASMATDMISKIVTSYFPIFLFVATGFEHVVANMFLIPEGLLTGRASFGVGEYIWKSIIASFLGNVMGAGLLVLPMVYLYGGDEHDPALKASGELPALPSIDTTRRSSYAQDKTKPYTVDIESHGVAA
ncbi:uncharacterized protein PFL1_00376 [Pseudozyma flocculosa PF-1]|uniref:Related to formate/nitrite transporter n=1 Tax=Pseudozyma flocculosa TaxID=84751 RepID=A0A5C3EUS1_9BASI|nr:uncharacterized protein PFL1_00376 [Pseudozyma flocculosa PF-1]EPQ32179.1 hypothetical protein PFL1_00376 [Pseudozyma flocculosa PF-1]SPO34879.1 related to formate/nitrite transporter [Pseudozyma flocculosa]